MTTNATAHRTATGIIHLTFRVVPLLVGNFFLSDWANVLRPFLMGSLNLVTTIREVREFIRGSGKVREIRIFYFEVRVKSGKNIL